MATLKVIVGFSGLRDDDLDTKASSVIKAMTGNINYTTPVPTLAIMQTTLTAYEVALTASANGNPEKTAVKDQKRRDLEAVLKQLGTYVQLNCKNDLGILLSSGFDAGKNATPVGILPKPENFKVENGPNAGTAKLSLDKIRGASSYRFEFVSSPVTGASVWAVNVGTARTNIVDGLISGQQYAFRVAGIGADPTVVYSDVLTRFAQ
jgi:hypothetical protein